MEMNTPKRVKTISSYISSPDDYNTQNWSFQSPSSATTPSSANRIYESPSPRENESHKRGRPRSEALTNLMIEGTISPSGIKCKFCHRVFPREKSLSAHIRIHTGERPYHCDFPGCSRAFTQSGQLKTHQRLHTGERPFICSANGCQMRFTHANRHCPDHPYGTLKRCEDFVIQIIPEQNVDVLKWLEKYRVEREDRTPSARKSAKRSKQPSENNDENEGVDYEENQNELNEGFPSENYMPVTPVNYKSSRKGLMCELDLNAGMASTSASPLSTKTKFNQPKIIQWQEPLSQDEDDAEILTNSASSTFNPKKKWLRDAWQELAKPLDADVPNCYSPPERYPTDPNMHRPSVIQTTVKLNQLDSEKPDGLVTDTSFHYQASLSTTSSSPSFEKKQYLHTTSMPADRNDKEKPVENRKWLGALALMQLAKKDDNSHERQEQILNQELVESIPEPNTYNLEYDNELTNPSGSYNTHFYNTNNEQERFEYEYQQNTFGNNTEDHEKN